ncbi:hypothetical protein IGL98_001338 [Enterococcus sp. DIV0840]|uniref:hypothetical protein n=1 Tax=Enterococcus TaxID=1350 RepID=UPI001A8D293A|nr:MULTISPECIES: hypothetical protein [Enterococcus]MBO0435219.1 hypothetical protein [Enterococcus sp. DIV0849a]MBO0474443.1 hypothetical protein [Enterococcus ureasiticus]
MSGESSQNKLLLKHSKGKDKFITKERIKIEKNQEYKYTDAGIDRIIKQKHNRWQQKRKAEIACFEQQKKTLSSYREVITIFLNNDLPFDIDIIDCVVDESIEMTKKNAQAIVAFVSSIKKGNK